MLGTGGQTMQRLIDANKLPVRQINVGTVMFPEMRYVVYLKDIQNAPTIDAEPVVRCKDCKYFMKYNGEPMCNKGLITAVKENHYCSFGVKKDKEKSRNDL